MSAEPFATPGWTPDEAFRRAQYELQSARFAIAAVDSLATYDMARRADETADVLAQLETLHTHLTDLIAALRLRLAELQPQLFWQEAR